MVNEYIKIIKDNNLSLRFDNGRLLPVAPGGIVPPEISAWFEDPDNPFLQWLKKSIPHTRPGDIARAPVSAFFPLTGAQKRLWLEYEMNPESAAYHVPLSLSINEEINFTYLASAFSQLIRRHESLRTRFLTDESGNPLQEITAPEQSLFRLEFFDMYNPNNSAANYSAWISKLLYKPFILEEGNLVRAGVVRNGPADYTLLLNLHHIITDGWSMKIIVKELLHFYDAKINGAKPGLPPLKFQFRDFAYRELSFKNTPAYTSARAWWLNEFSGGLPRLDFPSDFPRPAEKTNAGAQYIWTFDEADALSFTGFCRAENITLFSGLFGLVNTLLFRYTMQEDMIIGIPVAGRDHYEMESQVGMFVQTLPVRTPVVPSATFAQHCAGIQHWLLEASRHSLFGFEDLVAETERDRDRSRSPLFDVMIALQEEQPRRWQSSAGTAVMRGPASTFIHAKFDLYFGFSAVNDTIALAVEYNTDLYRAETIGRFCSQLEKLMQVIPVSAAVPLKNLDYSTAAEQALLFGSFQGKTVSPDMQVNLITLIANQVKLHPDAIAVTDELMSLTYREIWTQAGCIAGWLKQHCGLEKGDLVGIHLSRNAKMPVIMLGILRAGMAYVPLDPAYPVGRKLHILQDSDARLVLTDGVTPFDCGSVTAANVIQQWELVMVCEPFTETITHSDIAYLIYTSGSTGLPKGVRIRHGEMTNFLSWSVHSFEKRVMDGVFAGTSVCFDLSVFELFGTLCAGGRLIIAKDIFALPQFPDADVRLLNTVPSAMNELLEMDAVPESVTVINLAGEPLKKELVDRIYALHHVQQVNNLYGPSETTTYSTWTPVSRGGQVTVGKPVWNTKVMILDESLNVLPVGAKGELYIGGLGVTEGYHRNAELTASRYVTITVQGRPERMYRTGDIGRWLADGNIELAGRKDYQVKWRGYRIELGEIEARLSAIPGISEPVVILRNERLLAYALYDQNIEEATILARLRDVLPGYMVPMRIIRLDKIPVTPNGKTDRALLPDPQEEPVQVSEADEPSTESERMLLKIWQELLDRSVIGKQEDFFASGGHSLLAARLVARIHRECHVKLRLNDVFKTPTIAGLAAIIDKSDRTVLEKIPVLPRKPHYETSYAQRQLWVLQQLEGSPAAYNIPMQFEFDMAIDYNAMAEAFAILIERHESLRMVFVEVNGELRQKVCSPAENRFRLLFEDVSFYADAAGTAKAIIEKEILTPFDLRIPPLIRATLIRVSPANFRLVISIHHIVSDGWSLRIMIEELFKAYEALLSGNVPRLPRLQVQFKDIIAWQNNKLSKESPEQYRAYWDKMLRAPLPALDFPVDYPRLPIKTSAGKAQVFLFDKTQITNLGKLAAGLDATLFMALLASLKLLYYRYTHQTAFIIGSPTAGRDHLWMENQLGYYVRTFMVRTEISKGETYSSFLKKVAENTLEAFENQLYPIYKVVEEFNLNRDFSRSLLFDVMAVLQNHATPNELKQAGEAKESSVRMHENPHVDAKYDMLFSMIEQPDGLNITIEYNTDLISDEKIKRFASHYENLIAAIVASPDLEVDKLHFLEEGETETIIGFNTGKAAKPDPATVQETGAEAVAEKPTFADADTVMQHEEWMQYVNRIAAWLETIRGFSSDTTVAVFPSSDPRFSAALHAVMQAGFSCIPMPENTNLHELEALISSSRAQVLIGSVKAVSLLQQLLWAAPGAKHLLLYDCPDPAHAPEPVSGFSTPASWDNYYAITAGAEKQEPSALTGESRNAWNESLFSALHEKGVHYKNALLIGIDPDIDLARFATHAEALFAVDFSSETMQRARQLKRKEKIKTLTLEQLAAHELHLVQIPKPDCCMLYNVVHYFPGFNYLGNVLKSCIKLMGSEGKILITGVPEFQHKQDTTEQHITGQLPGLYFSREFFRSLQAEIPEIKSVTINNRTVYRPGEKGSGRFDVVLTLKKAGGHKKSNPARKKIAGTTDLKSLPAHKNNGRKRFSWIEPVVHYTAVPPVLCSWNEAAVLNLRRFVQNLLPEQPAHCIAFSDARKALFFPAGGGHYYFSPEEQKSAGKLCSLLQTHDIRTWVGTAIALNRLLDFLEASNDTPDTGKLSHIILSGETLSAAQWKRCKQELTLKRNIVVHQLFGYGHFPFAYTDSLRINPQFTEGIQVGYPLPEEYVLITDPGKYCSPIGVNGKMYVSGNFMPGFVHNHGKLIPAATETSAYYPGKHFYDTGNFGRWSREGELTIHLTDPPHYAFYETLAATCRLMLADCPLVSDFQVALSPSGNSRPNFRVYVVPAHDEVTPEMITAWITARCCANRITPEVVFRSKLIRDFSGNALFPETQHTGDVSEKEKIIIAIWKEVLKTTETGIHDSFFNLGGNSIKALMLVSALNNKFNARLIITDIFLAPTIAQQQLLLPDLAGGGSGPEITESASAAEYPVSHGQKRLWLLSQDAAVSLAYHMQDYFFYPAPFNTPAFLNAVYALSDRHESLRTVFYETRDGIRQAILPSASFEVPATVYDLRGHLNAGDVFQQLVAEHAAKPLDLEEGPLFRMLLAVFPDGSAAIHLLIHHIISDGWSMHIFRSELESLYRLFCGDTSVQLPPVPMAYRHYAVWEQLQAQSASWLSARTWWHKMLHALPAPPELPVDFRRPLVKGADGATAVFHFERETTEALKACLSQKECTLFMGVLSALFVLINKYSGQDDIILGTPVAGRHLPEIEKTIGFFVQTLPVRARVNPDTMFDELLGLVKSNVLGAFEHQHYPFDLLVEELRPARQPGRSPFFDVMVVLQNTGEAFDTGRNDTASQQDGASGRHVKFDLVFEFEEHNAGLQLQIEYDQALFRKETITQMALHLDTLFKCIAATPGMMIRNIDIRSAAERIKLIAAATGKTVLPELPQTLTGLFARQAELHPEAIAIITREGRYTFRQLDEESEALAQHLLQDYRVKSGDRVGVLMNREFRLIAGLLAVLKTGAAYVPLDPNNPPSRIELMVNDGQMKFTLTHKAVADRFPGLQTQFILEETLDREKYKTAAVKVNIKPDDLAYILFTSGSSGVPKGVMIRHRNIANLLHWGIQQFNADRSNVFFAGASVSFDLSVFELFLNLSAGSSLVLGKNLLDLADHPAREEVTAVFGVPSAFRELAGIKNAFPPRLNLVGIGGEPFDGDIIKELYDLEGVTRVVNLYGPTETAVVSNSKVLAADPAEVISIGEPVPNLQVYVLDQSLEPAPFGVTGEICIAGEGVGAGYLNRAELNVERFIADPFHPGKTMYRTGDLGRMQTNGSIVFSRRIDDQVKVRGFRVELAEIDSKLLLMPHVNNAVTQVVRLQEGYDRLEAWVTAGEAFSAALVKTELKKHLPEYMIPSVIYKVDKIPLTHAGKTDRAALLKMGSYNAPGLTAPVIGSTEIENQLLALFIKATQNPEMGLTDDFFAMGGHSLSAIRLTGMINKQFNLQLPFRTIFEFPDVKCMAEEVEALLWLSGQMQMHARPELN